MWSPLVYLWAVSNSTSGAEPAVVCHAEVDAVAVVEINDVTQKSPALVVDVSAILEIPARLKC